MAKIGNVVDAETASKYANLLNNTRAVIWQESWFKALKVTGQEATFLPKRNLCHLICRENDVVAIYSSTFMIQEVQIWAAMHTTFDYTYSKECMETATAWKMVVVQDVEHKKLALNIKGVTEDCVFTTAELLAVSQESEARLKGYGQLFADAVIMEHFAFSPYATTKLRPTHRHMGNPRKYPLQFQPIEIINLRLPEKIDHPESTGRSINLRFPVTGFIRRQWYPSLGIHKPIPIAPHWRGPEDAPIKPHTERVYKVTR